MRRTGTYKSSGTVSSATGSGINVGTSALIAVLLAAAPTPAMGQTPGPRYATPETRELVERMVAAHGGMAAWERAKSLSFTVAMYLGLPTDDSRDYYDNWRYYRVTLDPHTSRGWVELPHEAALGPAAGFDGTTVWRRDYAFDPEFQDGAYQLLYYHYAFMTLPWLTQQPGVVLRSAGTAELPGIPVKHPVVEATFEPEGKVHPGYFRLYIDPESYQLRGITHTVRHPLLPGDVLPELEANLPSGLVRVMAEWSEVEGLLLPRGYSSVMATDDGVRVMGSHLVLDVTIDDAFDVSSTTFPDGAEAVHTR